MTENHDKYMLVSTGKIITASTHFGIADASTSCIEFFLDSGVALAMAKERQKQYHSVRVLKVTEVVEVPDGEKV